MQNQHHNFNFPINLNRASSNWIWFWKQQFYERNSHISPYTISVYSSHSPNTSIIRLHFAHFCHLNCHLFGHFVRMQSLHCSPPVHLCRFYAFWWKQKRKMHQSCISWSMNFKRKMQWCHATQDVASLLALTHILFKLMFKTWRCNFSVERILWESS